MNLTHYNYELNISDNWGWYVDTENLLPINNIEQRQYIKFYKKPKYFNINLNKLEKIIEDENEDENDIMKNNSKITIYNVLNVNYRFPNNEKLPKYNFCQDKILKICSTAVITFILTYIVFFVL